MKNWMSPLSKLVTRNKVSFMAHHVYQSEALVLRGIDVREANRFVDVFTRELGLIRAAATSSRKESSKMRYSLQDYTHLDVSLVRGKEVWRITGAKERSNIYYKLKDDKKKFFLFKKVNSLLTRLLHGEEKNERLFDALLSFIEFLSENKIESESVKNIECLIVLRILYHLGYVAKKENMYETNEFKDEFLVYIKKNQKDVIQEINAALKESQL